MRRQAPTRPRKLPRQERSKETVETILEATARVLVRKGYEGTTTNRIAEASGYGVGSLYDYFPNKESLVAALIERHVQEMLAIAESSFRSHAASPPSAAVQAWVEGGVKAHLANPELHRVLIKQVHKVGDLERISEAEERIAQLVRSHLELHAGGSQSSNLSLAAFVVAQAVMSLAHKAIAEGLGSLEDGRLVEEIVALVAGYLAPGSTTQ